MFGLVGQISIIATFPVGFLYIVSNASTFGVVEQCVSIAVENFPLIDESVRDLDGVKHYW